jgi:hypothetical protein
MERAEIREERRQSVEVVCVTEQEAVCRETGECGAASSGEEAGAARRCLLLAAARGVVEETRS